MKKLVSTILGLGMAVTVMAPNPALAIAKVSNTPETVRYLREGATASAPLGFIVLCLKDAKQCRGGGAAKVAMSGDLLRKLKSVNSSVNRAIRPRRDKGDVWSVNVSTGDCEDYALTKRMRLIQNGVPASALRLATATTRWGESHLVLVVKTNKGDFVLDNLSGSVREWHKTGLNMIAMSGSNPRKWRKV